MIYEHCLKLMMIPTETKKFILCSKFLNEKILTDDVVCLEKSPFDFDGFISNNCRCCSYEK